MQNLTVNIKRKHPDAIMPTYATDGSGCFDIATFETGFILPGESKSFQIGLAFEIPENHAMLIFSRSGHGFKHGIRLSNCVGFIDSDYRNSIGVKLHNDGESVYYVSAGDRIAQAMIIPVPRVTWEEVEELSETVRGEGGFGSTGR